MRRVSANSSLDVAAAGYAALVAHARGDEAQADRGQQLMWSRVEGRAQPNGLEADQHGAWLAAMRGDAGRSVRRPADTSPPTDAPGPDRVARAWAASEELGDVPSATRLLALADDLTAGRVQASRKP